MKNKKHLGQNWLKNRAILEEIVKFAGVTKEDVVLEIGPGLGTLTSVLLRVAQRVTAVEFDADLAQKLPAQFPGKNLEVVCADILQFNLNQLPVGYKVVANLPYYITSKIIRLLLEADNRPISVTILVQKEVAQRLAQIGGGSVLGVAVENWAKVVLGQVVPAECFTPVPQVDSQVVRLEPRLAPLVADEKVFMRLVKAGFSAKRKKLSSSLSGGLAIAKDEAKNLLLAAKIDYNLRAQDLKFGDWQRLLEQQKLARI